MVIQRKVSSTETVYKSFPPRLTEADISRRETEVPITDELGISANMSSNYSAMRLSPKDSSCVNDLIPFMLWQMNQELNSMSFRVLVHTNE